MKKSLIKIFPNITNSTGKKPSLTPKFRSSYSESEKSEQKRIKFHNKMIKRNSDDVSVKSQSSQNYLTSIRNRRNGVSTSISYNSNWNIMKTVQIIRRFIEKFKIQSAIQSFFSLNQSHIDLIQDNAFFFKADKAKPINRYNVIYYLFFYNIKRLAQRIKVIAPDNIWINVFRIILWITLIIQIFTIPLKLSFSLEIQNSPTNSFLFIYMPIIICFADIILSFNIAYYEDGSLVTDQYKIGMKYLKFEVWVDLFTTLTLIINEPYIEFIQLLFYIRIYQVSTIFEEIDERFQLQQRYYTTFTLFKLLLQIFLTAHFFSCTFHYIAIVEMNNGVTNTWMHKKNIQNYSSEERYLYSLYFTFITMCTVGYGDITPNTSIEIMYDIIITILSCGQFGYVINTIGSIFLEQSQKQAAYRQKKYEISNYLRQRQIDMQLQVQVFKYLDYIHRKENIAPHKGQQILEEIPKNLRDAVYKDFLFRYLNQQKLFNQNFSTEFLEDLALNLQEVLFGPGEIIYQSGEQDDKIYFVVSGSILLFVKNSQNKQYTYDVVEVNLIQIIFTKYKLFSMEIFSGKIVFLPIRSGKPAPRVKKFLIYYSVVSLISSICQSNTQRIKYQNNNQIFAQLNKKERYCQMRDKIILNKCYLHVNCYPCQQYSHQILNCPMMHFVKSKEYIIRKYNHTKPHEKRMKYKRRVNGLHEGRFRTLMERQNVSMAVKYERKKLISKARKIKRREQRMRKNQDKGVLEQKLIEDQHYSKSSSSESDQNEEESDFDQEESDKQFFLREPKVIQQNGKWITNSSFSEELSDVDSLSSFSGSGEDDSLIKEEDEELEDDNEIESQEKIFNIKQQQLNLNANSSEDNCTVGQNPVMNENIQSSVKLITEKKNSLNSNYVPNSEEYIRVISNSVKLEQDKTTLVKQKPQLPQRKQSLYNNLAKSKRMSILLNSQQQLQFLQQSYNSLLNELQDNIPKRQLASVQLPAQQVSQIPILFQNKQLHKIRRSTVGMSEMSQNHHNFVQNMDQAVSDFGSGNKLCNDIIKELSGSNNVEQINNNDLQINLFINMEENTQNQQKEIIFMDQDEEFGFAGQSEVNKENQQVKQLEIIKQTISNISDQELSPNQNVQFFSSNKPGQQQQQYQKMHSLTNTQFQQQLSQLSKKSNKNSNPAPPIIQKRNSIQYYAQQQLEIMNKYQTLLQQILNGTGNYQILTKQEKDQQQQGQNIHQDTTALGHCLQQQQKQQNSADKPKLEELSNQDQVNNNDHQQQLQQNQHLEQNLQHQNVQLLDNDKKLLEDNQMFIYDFDRMKEYEKYFPHNNQSIILKTKKETNKILSKKIKTLNVYKKAVIRSLIKKKSKFTDEIISD